MNPTTGLSQREVWAITSPGSRRSVSTVVNSASPRQGHASPDSSVTDIPSSSMAFPVNSTAAPRSTAARSPSWWGSRAVIAPFWARSVPAPI